MKEIRDIIQEVSEIYNRNGKEAELYLKKARKLKESFGPGAAIVYCWFYSVPQKWTQVEPKIFQLMEYSNCFNLNTILMMPDGKIAKILRPMIFYNEIALQLKNFCSAIKSEYSFWQNFAHALENENIFTTFRKVRKKKGTRITFKNLAAMKSFVGMDDNFVILDTHVANVLGINNVMLAKTRANELLFKNLLEAARAITHELKKEYNDISTIKWSLSIWFAKAKISAKELLKNFHF
jgi:hypothetical protein